VINFLSKRKDKMFEDKKIDNEYNLKAVNYIRNIKSSK
jgi:hypothetical protein